MKDVVVRTKKNKNNTSGILGVNWSKARDCWHAKIGWRGRRIHLGYFSDITDAEAAYVKAKRKLLRKKRGKRA